MRFGIPFCAVLGCLWGWFGVAQLEAQQAVTTLCLLADNIQDPMWNPRCNIPFAQLLPATVYPKLNQFCSLGIMPFRPTVVCAGLSTDESMLQPLCNTLSPNGCLQRAADDVHQNGMRRVASFKCFALLCLAVLSLVLFGCGAFWGRRLISARGLPSKGCKG